ARRRAEIGPERVSILAPGLAAQSVYFTLHLRSLPRIVLAHEKYHALLGIALMYRGEILEFPRHPALLTAHRREGQRIADILPRSFARVGRTVQQLATLWHAQLRSAPYDAALRLRPYKVAGGLVLLLVGQAAHLGQQVFRQRRVVLLRAERFGVGAPVRPGFHAGLPRGPVGYDVVMYADCLARLPVHIGGHGYVFELRSGRQAALHAADVV